MRADRLLSLLMLLQARGRMTARALAAELEVSERTIYRDIDALSLSGVPIYSDRGPEGGYSLVESYRTSLTGLKEDEVRALFMLSIPAPLAELGVGQELKAALRKLVAALPAAYRGDEARVRQRIHLDATWWGQGTAVPHLGALHQAVWEDRIAVITYRHPFIAPVGMEQRVAPYGLVAKGGVWYVVCAADERVRAHRVSTLLDVRLTDQRFERAAEFDLARFWEEWCAGEEQHLTFAARVRVSPALARELPWHLGEAAREALERAERDAHGWTVLELAFESFEQARGRILSFGGAVEVLEPEHLRLSVLDFAQQTIARYQAGSPKEALP